MDDVAYYESQVQYQTRVGELEKERLRLERERSVMMRSDKKLQNLRIVKLRSYWQQVCEREKRARERNEDLLRDFEQLEIKLGAMEAKTNKLKKMKMDYDEKVKQMYPKWRHEVELARAKKQLKERGIEVGKVSQSGRLISNQLEADQEVPYENFAYRSKTEPEKVKKIRKKDVKEEMVRTLTPENFSLSLESEKPAVTTISHSVAVATSESTSVQSPVKLSEQASLQPPPDSFADTTPLEVIQVTTKSPMKTANETSNSDFSETSHVSKNENKVNSGVFKPEVQLAVKNQQKQEFDHQNTFASTRVSSPTKSNKSEIGSSSHHEKKFAGHNQKYREITPPQQTYLPVASSSPIGNQEDVSASISSISIQHDELQSPEPKKDSRLSVSSIGSDVSPRSNLSPRSDVSSRNDAPLTASAAYQALLKQHSGTNPNSLHIPNIEEESDEDDLENLLSPHGTGKERSVNSPHSEDSISGNSVSSPKPNAPVYIPTAMSNASTSRQYQQHKKRTVPKAPWDTDSEEELENENTNMSNTGGSSMWDQKLKKYDQDDFDFYD